MMSLDPRVLAARLAQAAQHQRAIGVVDLPYVSPPDECRNKGGVYGDDGVCRLSSYAQSDAAQCVAQGWTWNTSNETCTPPPSAPSLEETEAYQCAAKGGNWDGFNCEMPSSSGASASPGAIATAAGAQTTTAARTTSQAKSSAAPAPADTKILLGVAALAAAVTYAVMRKPK